MNSFTSILICRARISRCGNFLNKIHVSKSVERNASEQAYGSLVKKFVSFCGTRGFITVFTKNLSPVPFLSQITYGDDASPPSFVQLAVCLTTGPKSLPKRALHIVRSGPSSFRCEYPLLSLRSTSSFLRLLLRLIHVCHFYPSF
jgi:hypothetical protein